jgi:hypothetical protein
MHLQEEVRELVVADDLVVVFVVAEDIGDDVPDFVLVLFH